MAVLDSVYQVPLTHEGSMDDSDEGFGQGDCSLGTFEDDPSLPPLLRMQKYSQSTNILNRQMAIRIVKDLLRTVPIEILAKDLRDIMKELTRIGDESILRADLLEQIPHIAAQTIESSNKLGDLRNTICDYLIPLVVRNLGCVDTAVDKAAHTALIQLVEQEFITKQQIEIQVCPSILALSKLETSDINASTGAITLMSRLAQHLGRDVMERVFLKRFTELCTNQKFFVRKMCAANFGEFCNVVGPSAFENILVNFSFKTSYQLRCQLAAISYNNKEEYLNILISSSGSTIGHFTKTFINRLALRRKRIKEQSKKRIYKQKVGTCLPDQDYGAVEEYLTDEEIKDRKIKLEAILRKTCKERDEIEENTRGQSVNPLWFQHRQFRLTASNFGKICKRKQTSDPTKLAKIILCNKFQGNSATRYGQENEFIAIHDFEELTGLTLNPCGIFVGEDNDYFLGAIPDEQ